MFCSTCGAQLPPNVSFCPRCGCACASANSTVRDAAAYAARFAPFGTARREPFSAKLSWDYFKKCWRDWSWEGRATRTEFWLFVAWKFAFQAAIYCVSAIGIWSVLIFTTFGAGMFSNSNLNAASPVVALPFFGLFGIFYRREPSFFVGFFTVDDRRLVVRRLHDVDLTGALAILCFLGQIGTIATIVFGVLEPTPTANRFGPNPRFATEAPSGSVPKNDVRNDESKSETPDVEKDETPKSEKDETPSDDSLDADKNDPAEKV